MHDGVNPEFFKEKFNVTVGLGDPCELIESIYAIDELQMQAHSAMAQFHMDIMTEDGNPFGLPGFLYHSNAAVYFHFKKSDAMRLLEALGCE